MQRNPNHNIGKKGEKDRGNWCAMIIMNCHIHNFSNETWFYV